MLLDDNDDCPDLVEDDDDDDDEVHRENPLEQLRKLSRDLPLINESRDLPPINKSASKLRNRRLLTDFDANAIIDKPCNNCTCNDRCLMWNGKVQHSVNLCHIVKDCRNEVEFMEPAEKKAFLRTKVSGFNYEYHSQPGKQSRLLIQYKVGAKSKKDIPEVNVCPTAFRVAYNCSKDFMKDICRDIANGVRTSARPYNDRSVVENIGGTDTIDFLTNEAYRKGEPLDPKVVRRMKMVNGYKSQQAVLWMEEYFELMGDKCPNTDGEIHLEPITKQEIWSDYQQACVAIYKDDDYLSYPSFCTLWTRIFPHVLIREYKQVSIILFEEFSF